MKKILPFLFFLPIISRAQLTKLDAKDSLIGKVKRVGEECAWLEKAVMEGDTTYVLRYRNYEFTQITDIQYVSFKGWNTVHDLYLTLIEALKKEKGEKANYILGENQIMLVTEKMLGKKWVTIYFANRGHTSFSERELASLFNVK